MSMNLRPVMLADKVFDYLNSTAMKMLPWERYAVISFDSCILTLGNKMIKCIGKDYKGMADEYSSLDCIIVQLSYLQQKCSIPIAVIYYNESFNARTVAHILGGIMHDLMMLSIRIVATVCAPSEQFIQVVAHLCSVTKSQICAANILSYTIGSVGGFGRQVMHIFDLEVVLSQIWTVFSNMNFEFEDNGYRCTAKFEEVIDFIKHLPEDLRQEYLPANSTPIKHMRRLFSADTTLEMRKFILNDLSTLSPHTERFCDFFAQTLITMRKRMHTGNKAAMRKSFYKILAVLNSMVLIKPSNNIFHDKMIDNITKVSDSIIESYFNYEENVYEVPLGSDNDHTYYATVIPAVIEPSIKQYFRYFGLNMIIQTVNGISAIYESLERHNVPSLKLKVISLITPREIIASIHKAFELGGLDYIKSTLKLEPDVINVIHEAFYNGFKLPEYEV